LEIFTKWDNSEWNALENSIGKYGSSLLYLLFQQIILSLICSCGIELMGHFEITVLLNVHALKMNSSGMTA
jgi:hypothetical protein